MSSGAAGVEAVEAPRPAVLATEKDFIDEKQIHDLKGSTQASDSDELTDEILVGPNGEQYPTKEELLTLRRTHGHVPFVLYTIAFVELCERFAYYGTTQVCKYT
jgi:POT family proton-dependent oligopeptide transporter